MVDVILTGLGRGLGNHVGCLTLGANHEHTSAGCGNVADRGQSAIQKRNRLLQVENVNIVADAKDVLFHLRVPAARVMAEMDTSFKQLAHRKRGNAHLSVFLRLCLHGFCPGTCPDTGALRRDVSPTPRTPVCVMNARFLMSTKAKCKGQDTGKCYAGD